MKGPLKFSRQPDLKNPALIVAWSVDASNLGTKITDYLNRKIGGQNFCEIEPEQFFPLGGVIIEDDLVQFPESQFYACPNNDLIIFRSTPPSFDWYHLLNLILDVAERYYVKEIYTIGGMISLSSHTTPRQMVSTFNSAEFQQTLSQYGLARGPDYETPPGQRPTLNSFLSWAAQRRNIPTVSLWVPVPFYLVTMEDPGAQKRVLEFFNKRFNLQIDVSDLDEEVRQQNQKIAEARQNSPKIDEAINRLESNLRLSEEDSQSLITEIESFFKEKKD